MILKHVTQGVYFVVCRATPSAKDAARRKGERGSARLSLCEAGREVLVEDGRTGFLGEVQESHPQDDFEGIHTELCT
jgi:hypothetical protein